ncbi:secretion protein HlyD family protein [Rhodopseudomonas palustris TIE-1]|uniref:efflux RND transporter periplasmic adaptor subunit n=1 Tax=Rhodopseudomonas palustris TaxID=1076 RepID=UPI000164B0F9|nr:HlyD family secretion protein [Rhodopseudomonas palustris]ACF00076.1 secretion protein HlyD family protein [Rhodopseudomonas palustris TIE-1]
MTGVDTPAARRLPVGTVLSVLVTLAAVAAAAYLGRMMWQAYMAAPWTRDGTVRAYVVGVTPQVSGRISELAVKAAQYVRKGDPLMKIDPVDFQIALASAEATVASARADLANKQAEAERRDRLSSLAVSKEEQQIYAAAADIAAAALRQALSNLDKARLALSRTEIVSPVDGYVTNLVTQAGDYATGGQRALSIVDSGSFWVDAYFEETLLRGIRVGDRARVALMAYPQTLAGEVVGIERGIAVPNAESDPSGLATVNPVFTWVRLAQRVPVRIALKKVPPSIVLAAGLTATVSILPNSAPAGAKPIVPPPAE